MQPLEKETLLELQIFRDGRKEKTICDLFDGAQTSLGSEKIGEWIKTPKNSIAEIELSFDAIRFVWDRADVANYKFSRSYVNAFWNYLNINVAYITRKGFIYEWIDGWKFERKYPVEMAAIRSGVFCCEQILNTLSKFFDEYIDQLPAFFSELYDRFCKISDFEPIKLLRKTNLNEISDRKVRLFDKLLRTSCKEQLYELGAILAEVDAMIGIANNSKKMGFVLPEVVERANVFEIEGLFHPLLENPVSNSIHILEGKHLILLTGANSSGKSTFLKAFGIAAYLAHLGWPVPSQSMSVSFLDAIYTSIHLTDNIGLGYSHFFSEVLKIKKAVLALKENKKCLIIIDELFRGTNNLDSHYCSQRVLRSFEMELNSTFLISTHSTDLVVEFENCKVVDLKCFRCSIRGGQFYNTYQIYSGISFERVGRDILELTGLNRLLSKMD